MCGNAMSKVGDLAIPFGVGTGMFAAGVSGNYMCRWIVPNDPHPDANGTVAIAMAAAIVGLVVGCTVGSFCSLVGSFGSKKKN